MIFRFGGKTWYCGLTRNFDFVSMPILCFAEKLNFMFWTKHTILWFLKNPWFLVRKHTPFSGFSEKHTILQFWCETPIFRSVEKHTILWFCKKNVFLLVWPRNMIFHFERKLFYDFGRRIKCCGFFLENTNFQF